MEEISSSLFYHHSSAVKTKHIRTVKELKEHLEDISDNTEVKIWNGNKNCSIEVSIDSSTGHYKYYTPLILRTI